jgi:tetratricopeptide (TPR) repeat protein
VAPSPTSYHLVNVVLHGLVSLLVFYFARTLLSSTWLATVTALLFAVHPIHTEAVASIVGRAELLAAFCVLVTLLGFIHGRRSEGRRRTLWITVSSVAFLAGLLAKEGAFAALPLLVVVDAWLFRKDELLRRVTRLIPYVLVVFAALVLRWFAIGTLGSAAPTDLLDNPLAHVSWVSRLRTATVILWEYVSQLAFPWHLSADYSFNQIEVITSWLDPRFLAACSLLLAIGAGLVWAAFRAPAVVIATSLMLAPLAITANVLFPIGTIKAERLLYLPSIGWCLLGAWIASRIVRLHPRATIAVLTILVIAYAGRTWERNTVWADNLSLFQATVASSPSSAKAHHNLATAYFEAGRFDEAMLHYRQALGIYPAYSDSAFGVARIYDLRGLDAGALHWYEQALRLDWKNVNAHLNRGIVRLRLGEFTSAEASFLTGLQLDPTNPRLLRTLALVRQKQGLPWAEEDLLARIGVDTNDDVESTVVASLQSPTAMEQP